MATAARAREILDYLAANEVAAPPAVIHNQLRIFRNAKWSRDTTKRRLKDFTAAGWVDYLPDYGSGYYIISATGADKASETLTDAQINDEVIGLADQSDNPDT